MEYNYSFGKFCPGIWHNIRYTIITDFAISCYYFQQFMDHESVRGSFSEHY